MRNFILGTAGHIDHGKTALVRALTGVDTDRLPEEKRRGITIDLGFARLQLADDCEVGIVDVPGHEAFVRNMLAGATGIDFALLVIAADEGVMPQTREHLAIIELLGAQRAVVAITKCDLVDDEWLDLVADDVAKLLAPTPLRCAPVVPVSARTGAGLDALLAALAELARHTPTRISADLFRMPIDRVFTVHGTGTVVTGTVWSGCLHVDDQVRIEPAGLSARVRGLQHHGLNTTTVAPGARAAIALAATDRQLLNRGDTLVTGQGWAAGNILTARITTLRDAVAPLKPRQRVRVHLGTAEVLARVALVDREIEPGGTAILQLRLEAPILARARDPLIIRSYSPVLTIAGGVVLEPFAPKRKRLTTETRSLFQDVLHPPTAARAAVLLATGEVMVAQLPILTGLPEAAVIDALGNDSRLARAGNRVLDRLRLDELQGRIIDQVLAHHVAQPLEEGIEREALRRVTGPDADLFDVALHQALASAAIATRGSTLAAPNFEPRPAPGDQPALDRLVTVFVSAGLAAPSLDELQKENADAQLLPLLRYLERNGTLVRLTTDRWVSTAAIRAGTDAISAQLPVKQSLDVAEFRKVLGLSRKHLIPLLEYFDRIGFTVRRGDARVINGAPDAVPLSSD